MSYIIRLLSASAIAMLVVGLVIAHTPWYTLQNAHDIVLFLYLALVTVGLPGLTWWVSAKLLRVL